MDTLTVKKINGTPVVHQKYSLYEGYFPPFMEEINEPTIQWHGDPIDASTWNMIKAFFRWTFHTRGTESQVRLYYNESPNHTGSRWAAVVLPQYCESSLRTKEFDEHADREAAFAHVLQTDGWQPAGTAHHHCELDAFQSGVDHEDEKDQNGIHITVGNIPDKTWTFHARVTYKKLSYSLEKPEQLLAGITEKESTVLRNPGANMTFPSVWKTRIHEPPPKPPSYFQKNGYTHNRMASIHSRSIPIGYGGYTYPRYPGETVHTTNNKADKLGKTSLLDRYSYWASDIEALDKAFAEYDWDLTGKQFVPGNRVGAQIVEDRVYTARVAMKLIELIKDVKLKVKPGKVTEAMAPILAFIDGGCPKGEILPFEDEAFDYYEKLLMRRIQWAEEARKDSRVIEKLKDKKVKNPIKVIQDYVDSRELTFGAGDDIDRAVEKAKAFDDDDDDDEAWREMHQNTDITEQEAKAYMDARMDTYYGDY